MQDAYWKAFLAEPVTVLGVQLRPFSLGHSLLLDVYESPFCKGGAVTLTELVFAVWICSRKFQDAIDDIHKDQFDKECRRWGRKCRRADFNREMEVFDQYVSEHSQCPRRWDTPGKKSGGPRVPWQLAMFWNLCRGQIDESLWDLPLGRAIVYSATRLTSEGDQDFVSDEEWEFISDGKSEDSGEG